MYRFLFVFLFVCVGAAPLFAKTSGSISLDNPADLRLGDVAHFSVAVQDLREGDEAAVAVQCEFDTTNPLVQDLDLGVHVVSGGSLSVLLQNIDSNQLYAPATCTATLFTRRTGHASGPNGGNTLAVETFTLEPIPYEDPTWPFPPTLP